jgi:DnaJ-class molecular chaperone
MFFSPHQLFQQQQQIVPQPRGTAAKPFQKQYYTNLGVEPGASDDDIKKGYRKMALANHPDRGGSDQKFKDILKSYEVLSTPQTKMCYDAFGSDFNEIKGIELYVKSIKSQDIQKQIEISVSDAIQGKTIKLAYQRIVNSRPENASCDVCILPLSNPESEKPIVISCQGNLDRNKIPGDLVLIIVIKDDKKLKKAGRHLLYHATIDFISALTGSPVEITHPNGKILKIKGPSVFRNDHWFKIEGQGIDEGKSHLFVQFQVTFPAGINEHQKEKIMKLFKYTPLSVENMINTSTVSEETVQAMVNASIQSNSGGGPQMQECRQQ